MQKRAIRRQLGRKPAAVQMTQAVGGSSPSPGPFSPLPSLEELQVWVLQRRVGRRKRKVTKHEKILQQNAACQRGHGGGGSEVTAVTLSPKQGPLLLRRRKRSRCCVCFPVEQVNPAPPAEVPALTCAFTRLPSSWVIFEEHRTPPEALCADVPLPADAFSPPQPLSAFLLLPLSTAGLHIAPAAAQGRAMEGCFHGVGCTQMSRRCCCDSAQG